MDALPCIESDSDSDESASANVMLDYSSSGSDDMPALVCIDPTDDADRSDDDNTPPLLEYATDDEDDTPLLLEYASDDEPLVPTPPRPCITMGLRGTRRLTRTRLTRARSP